MAHIAKINDIILGLSVFLLTLASTAAESSETAFDTAIINGRVIDPETKLDAIRNIGINDGKISVITTENIKAQTIIDAQNLVVSPGFIDLHAHGQSILSGRVQALDGVTTALELEAGALPISDYYEKRSKEGRPINYGASVNWASARIAVLYKLGVDNPEAITHKFYSDLKWRSEIATRQQLDAIKELIQHELDQGALGIGFLSGYAPDSGYKEYYEVSELAAKDKAPTFTHGRYLSMTEPDSSFQGIEEIIAVAASTGVQAHIVHLNSISLKDINTITNAISKAQSNGVNISTEAYPYGAGSTSIGAAMFRGEAWRQKLGGLTANNFELNGQRLTENEFKKLQEESPETGIIVHLLDLDKESDQAILDQSILFPNSAIASDGVEWSLNGESLDQNTWPLPSEARAHPRSAGTYSRFLRIYVREQEKLSLSQAIAKASLIPATILQDSVPQMKHKGRIQVGADADLIIFDLSKVSDKATFETPAKTSQGFQYVLVNGETLVKEGELITTILPGKPIRRSIDNK